MLHLNCLDEGFAELECIFYIIAHATLSIIFSEYTTMQQILKCDSVFMQKCFTFEQYCKL